MVKKVGVIGLAFGAQFHIPAFSRLPGVEVTALADGGSGKAVELSKTMSPTPEVYSSGLDLVANASVDMISIATPPEFHAGIVLAAIETGIAVLCEKPFGLSTLQAKEMLLAATQKGIKTAVGLEMRYDRGIAQLATLVHAGRIGDARNITVQWLTGGGVNPNRLYSWRDDIKTSTGIIGEFGAHVFDYAPWIMQSPIRSLRATSEIVVHQRPDRKDELQTVTTPDTLEVDCTFDNSATGHFAISNARPDGNGHRITVTGTNGTLSLHLRPPFQERDTALTLSGVDGVALDVLAPLPAADTDLDTRHHAVNTLIEEFVAGNTPKTPDFQDGLTVHRTLDVVGQSIETGKEIKIQQDP